MNFSDHLLRHGGLSKVKVESDHRRKFCNLKRRSLKKIRALTGFEPVISAILVRCSTSWTMKQPFGSEVNLLSSYLPVQWNDVKFIWNNSCSYCGCRWKWRVIIAVNFPIEAIGKKKPEKKIRASMGFEPVASAIPVWCSTNWAMKPHEVVFPIA